MGELAKALEDLRRALSLEDPTPEAKVGAERIEKRLAADRVRPADE